jgi:hypothetical protein
LDKESPFRTTSLIIRRMLVSRVMNDKGRLLQ